MDAEAVTDQIKVLRNLIGINLSILAQRECELEGVFVHRDLVLHQIATLDAVLEDSIKLQSRNTSREPAFLREQMKNLLTVAQDMQWLKEPGVGSKKLRLQTTSDAFILKMMVAVNTPAIENIDICTASGSEVDVHSLNVMHPEFVKTLMCWFMAVTQSHVARNRETAVYMDSRDSAGVTMATLREEAATLRAAEAGMQTKMQELEAATKTKVTELEAAMRAHVAELEAGMKAKVADLEATIGDLQRQKTNLEETLRTSQLLLGNLAEEKRRLEESSKASEAAARAALEAAQGEAATLRTISADCGRKIAEQIVQLSRFQELVDARDNELAALKVARAEPPRRPLLTLRYIPEVKPMTSSHDSHRSSPSGAPSAGSSKVPANASNEDAGDEEEDKDEQEEIEEDSKSESKDGEEEEEIQVDEEMMDTTEVLEAELQDMKAKLQAALKKVARLEVELVLCRDGPFQPGGSSAPSAADQIPPSLASVNLASLALLALPHRAKELAKLAEVKVDLPPRLSGMYGVFTRASIKDSLGPGSVSKFLVRCTNSQTERAKKKGISSFLCIHMDMNPWLPAAPGRHGYMQAWFDQDLKLLLDGQTQHVFIGAGRYFCYYGEYRIRRVDDLTLEEWSMLPLPARVVYAELTLTKKFPALTGKRLSTKDVFERYEAGQLKLPCVQLECIGFDMDFYGAIVGDNCSYEKYDVERCDEEPTIPISQSPSQSRKRRKSAVEDA